MTEFEINKKVAEKLGLNIVGLVESKRVMVLQHYYNHYEFDPCNNIKQAWEIMMKHNICVTKSKGKYISFYNLEFENSDDGYVPDIETQNAKPFVAAMLVFLEI